MEEQSYGFLVTCERVLPYTGKKQFSVQQKQMRYHLSMNGIWWKTKN